MTLTRAFTLVRKARSNPRQALQRSWKLVEGRTVSLLRPGLQRRRPGNVVMLHVGRSGSTVLGDMLDQHRHVYWDGEIYHRWLGDRSPDGDPVRYLSRRMTRAGSRYYGFELKPVHLKVLDLELDDFVNTLDGLGFTHFIVLEHKNYLRKILSSVIAHQSTVFHRAPSDRLTENHITLDLASVEIDNTVLPLLDFLTRYEEFFDTARRLLDPARTLWLTYESDIFYDPGIAYDKTCSLLGIDPQGRPEIRYGKTNPFPVNRMLSNFPEVERALRGTRFEWMLFE